MTVHHVVGNAVDDTLSCEDNVERVDRTVVVDIALIHLYSRRRFAYLGTFSCADHLIDIEAALARIGLDVELDIGCSARDLEIAVLEMCPLPLFGSDLRYLRIYGSSGRIL